MTGEFPLYATVVDVSYNPLRPHLINPVLYRNTLIWIPPYHQIKPSFRRMIRSAVVYAPDSSAFYGYQLTEFKSNSYQFGKIQQSRFIFTILAVTHRGFQVPFSVYEMEENYMLQAMVACILRVSPLLKRIKKELKKKRFIEAIRISISFHVTFMAKKIIAGNQPRFFALKREIFIDIHPELLLPIIPFFPEKIENKDLADSFDFYDKVYNPLREIMRNAFLEAYEDWVTEGFEKYDSSIFPELDEDIDRVQGLDDFDTIVLSISHPITLQNVILPKIDSLTN